MKMLNYVSNPIVGAIAIVFIVSHWENFNLIQMISRRERRTVEKSSHVPQESKKSRIALGRFECDIALTANEVEQEKVSRHDSKLKLLTFNFWEIKI